MHADLFADGEEVRLASPLEARKKAMDYLARREYGRAELSKKLAGAGFTAEAVQRAVDQLSADGLQDDRRFVGALIDSRARHGKGPLRIQADLSQRGIDAGLINAGLAATDVDWREQARSVRRKKFGEALPDGFRAKARQMRFLQYRGFTPDQVKAAVGADDD
jgi:regulatory protein